MVGENESADGKLIQYIFKYSVCAYLKQQPSRFFFFFLTDSARKSIELLEQQELGVLSSHQLSLGPYRQSKIN